MQRLGSVLEEIRVHLARLDPFESVLLCGVVQCHLVLFELSSMERVCHWCSATALAYRRLPHTAQLYSVGNSVVQGVGAVLLYSTLYSYVADCIVVTIHPSLERSAL